MSAGATVTQADREAAASITAMAELREMVAGGDYDEHAYVQAFARHRLAAAAEFAAREAALVEALGKLCRVLMPIEMSLLELEMCDQHTPDDAVLFSFMGSGASDHTTVGEYRAAMDAAQAACAHTTSEGEG